jgi:hypothetical protein
MNGYYENTIDTIILRDNNNKKINQITVKNDDSSFKIKEFNHQIVIESAYSCYLVIERSVSDNNDKFKVSIINNDGRLFGTFRQNISIPANKYFTSIASDQYFNKINFIKKYNNDISMSLNNYVSLNIIKKDSQHRCEFRVNINRVIIINKNQNYIWFK